MSLRQETVRSGVARDAVAAARAAATGKRRIPIADTQSVEAATALAQQNEDKFKAFQQENPRLVKENNELHHRLIEDGESLRQRDRE